MSMSHAIHAPALARPAHHGFFGRIVDAVVSWNNARVTRDALARLSDRELNDIGLSRCDIDSVARGL